MVIVYNHESIFGEYYSTIDSKVYKSRIRHRIYLSLLDPSWDEHPAAAYPVFQCVCLEFLLNGSSEISCNPINSFNNTIMHCRDFSGKGYFQIQSNSSVGHVGAFSRLNGPMIDTVLFEPVEQDGHMFGDQITVYVGLETTAERSIFISQTQPLKPFLSRDPLVWIRRFTPQLFSTGLRNLYRLIAPVFGTGITIHTHDDELSLYQVPVHADYISAYTGLCNTLPRFEFSDLKQQKRDICMYGDSQMRNLLNSIGGQVNQDTCFPLLQQEYKGDCEVDGFRWKAFRYPYEWSFESDMPGCSQVFVNFGQWPAGWPSSPTPWTFAQYRVAVHDFIAILIETRSRHPHLRITWVDTNPHPVMSAQASCPPTDWRFPHVLAAYNRIAREEVLATNGSIGFIETFSISFPLFDLSFDMAHYQGPVGIALANVLAGCILGAGV
eukprot:CAMPEP_0172202070 /NCGR_PEP_ID=MMETSP1050-20130122/30409_1 /TAXON_ID=233186 /ORGANISM="Cryptomonas curvata, Strain CCAP979/52" /LENGTH=437 /DNA_ID=CAMNT_0012879903 /DNA_START=128 /DNA_END=1442 /DNA_ORIENTATION=+